MIKKYSDKHDEGYDNTDKMADIVNDSTRANEFRWIYNKTAC